MVTIFDVAKEAGVSKSTVSRVLNNDSGVKPETRELIESAIKKLNYTPSYMAQAIRTKKSHTLALVVPEYTNIFYSEMFKGVEDIAVKNGYLVLVCDTEGKVMSDKEYIDELLKRNIDGIIYNTYHVDDKMISYLNSISESTPVVYMNKMDDGYSFVCTDGFESTRQAVHFLYEKGKRNIGYVLNTMDISIIEERYLGYLQGIKDVGLDLKEEWTYRAQSSTEPDYIKLGYNAAEYFSSINTRPDAILTATDMLGIGCIKGFKEFGIRVPEDISIVGYDNIFLGELVEPALTTIAQPIREMGRAAAEIILKNIEGIKSKNKVVFQGQLIERKTT